MGGKTNRDEFLRFSEETNALDYLERAGEFIVETSSNPSAWKWVVLALHGALYGFAITACKGTHPLTVTKLTKKGKEKLITLDEALKMCQDREWMGTLMGGIPLILSGSQKDSIRILKSTLRNNFEHRIPGLWGIEIHGMPRISIDVLEIIRFLSVETFRYQHLNLSQRKKIKSIVFQSKKLLKQSPLYKESMNSDRA